MTLPTMFPSDLQGHLLEPYGAGGLPEKFSYMSSETPSPQTVAHSESRHVRREGRRAARGTVEGEG
jgi:hypothetical protein